jgi:putative lipoprotein
MNIAWVRTGFVALALVGAFGAGIYGQDTGTAAQTPQAGQAQEHNNMRRAIRWKAFEYTCDGGTKLTAYLSDQLAKVRFGDKTYLMHQTESADGNRYSDGKVVWWGKGKGGFLQEDTPDGNGNMIVQNCKLDQPLNSSAVTGTVTYLQRMALPANAVIQVQLLDVSLADAPSKIIAEQSITLGQRQVPVPFTLNYDPTKIDQKHSYSVSAKIMVDGAQRFISDQSHPVITRGNPSKVDLVLKQVAAPAAK